ncbi:hypothetical protein NRK67_04005 [Fusobacteria bacterium ZRK30]|nr:hypothetical protein NRK67_04005 [Fusobacteria bacterium ZRK30]
MAIEEIYNEIYISMQISKNKGIKMVLNNSLESVLFVVVGEDEVALNSDDKGCYIYRTGVHIDELIKKIILEKGNREKIKLRNFFLISHIKIWGECPIL